MTDKTYKRLTETMKQMRTNQTDIESRKIYRKHFNRKGSQINYFNKVRANAKIAWCSMSNDMFDGLTVTYTYLK